MEEHSNTYDVYMEFESEDMMSTGHKEASGRGHPDLQRSYHQKEIQNTECGDPGNNGGCQMGKHAILYFAR